MLTVAYLANQFPSPVEPYVADEIAELQSRGIRVISGTVRQPRTQSKNSFRANATVAIQPVGVVIC
jgi:hypothetical protein